MSSHSPIHFPIFQWTCPFSHLQCFLLFLPFNQLPFPHSFSYFSITFPFPYSLSYFSYLWINSNSPIHFPTFQWVPPFPHSFSYFFYLSNSSHSRIHFPTFQWAPLPPFFPYFSYLSIIFRSPIFIFLLFLHNFRFFLLCQFRKRRKSC